ncbi:hypothetical protein BMS_2545 [Halobacteriovorax marinus SJ]|uniref:Uncharacterized protein n=1 Tax=Halobacteriovorax marinus (strain ATCC BAA-682 / DSM 15412 / SJ) TaxID=862908 RepID=E1X5L4_HALMS|nr:hypothetical protein [Halobacteriovorax marinus]CBW27335.1 hypothetical protein BMS_2545 [Halobacteriovorax marinus SJ]
MSLKENGISSPLELFKESTKRKNQSDKKKLCIQFLVIFILSHFARTLLQTPEVVIKSEEVISKRDGYTRLEIKAYSIIPNDQKLANLIHTTSATEIQGVHILQRTIHEEGQFTVLLDIPTKYYSTFVMKPNNWKLIPFREIPLKRRKNFEIIF